jgi:hypothetical protein
MRIRKQVYELTTHDIQQHPIWEYALDEENAPGQDEATVRPLDELPPVREDRTQILLAAQLRLSDGTLEYGVIKCPTEAEWDMSDLIPAMLIQNGMVSFWQGIRKPKPEMIVDQYARLGRRAEQVFPIVLESLIEVDGDRIRGVIEGFYHYDWEPGKRMYPFKKHLNLKVLV